MQLNAASPVNEAEVQALRKASREVVRQLGFLDRKLGALAMPPSHCHALIEIERQGVLAVGDLSELLRLDKSTTSRIIKQLADAGLVKLLPDPNDARRKPVALTRRGREKTARIHDHSNQQVEGALSWLSEDDRAIVIEGMALYARALARRNLRESLSLRLIRESDDPHVARLIRTVMPEYGAEGPGYAINDPEVGAMSSAYSGERAQYWVFERDGAIVGGGGFAPLEGADHGVCELRKMYFYPELRGNGLGRELLALLLHRAREAGYSHCYIETLVHMHRARALYESVGFAQRSDPMGSTGHFGCDCYYLREL